VTQPTQNPDAQPKAQPDANQAPQADCRPLEAKLGQALSLQHQGDLQGARHQFDIITTAHPQCAEAHYFKGMLENAEAHFEEALKAIGEAIQINPKGAVFYGGKGTVHFHQEQWQEAAEAYETAIQLDANNHELLNNLGSTYLQLDRPKDALRVLIRATELQPSLSTLHLQMARALKALNQFGEALESCKTAVYFAPTDAEAHFMMGELYHTLEEERLKDPKAWQEAFSYRPMCIQAYLKGLKFDPENVEAFFMLGNEFTEADQLEEALICYEAALEMAPEMALVWNNQGFVYRSLGLLEESETAYQKALALDPDLSVAHFNRSVLLFLQKRLPEAWEAYEWRKARTSLIENQPFPLWQGEDLSNKTVWIRCEQGYGDTLQFIRFCQPLKQQGARLIIECQAGLKTLLEKTPWLNINPSEPSEKSDLIYNDLIYEKGSAHPGAFTSGSTTDMTPDYMTPLMSLPKILGLDYEALTDWTQQPDHFPYLAVSEHLKSVWQERLSSSNQEVKKIGIVWSGSGVNLAGRHRSVLVDYFLPLTQLPHCQLISLQVEPDGRHKTQDYQGFLKEANILPVAQYFDNFAETAACLEQLDLVISIDTSVAHLAGALGKPTWILLPQVSDWRWMNEVDRTVWYPHVRLFHQGPEQNWQEAFQQILDTLK
jgi:tetratricopeptide (TPR) repeat protein